MVELCQIARSCEEALMSEIDLPIFMVFYLILS